jgi:hypothetical protein
MARVRRTRLPFPEHIPVQYAAIFATLLCMVQFLQGTVLVGLLDIRLKQTGLISSGGYIWGTYGMDQQKHAYDQLANVLAKSPDADTLVLVNFPGDAKGYTSMALVADPGLQRILVYDSKTGSYLANDIAGLKPKDDLEDLNDAQAYHWDLPMDAAAAKAEARDKAVWIGFQDEKITELTPDERSNSLSR